MPAPRVPRTLHGVHVNLATMKYTSIFHLPLLAAAVLLAGCATPIPEAVQATGVATDQAEATTNPRTQVVAPVPQPVERPVAPPSVTDPAIPQEQRIAAFVDYTARTYGVDPALVRSTLVQAQFKQSIIDAMSRPAEKVRTWAGYRPIFLNPKRIEGGVAFLTEHRAQLDRVAAATGVPAEYIVAIIGVNRKARVSGLHHQGEDFLERGSRR